MLNQIKLVVFSHHHNKTEEFLMERDVDFSVVRDTMYKYSKTSQEKFFSHPVFAFMFTYFAENKKAMVGVEQKYATNKQHLAKIATEIAGLKLRAEEVLTTQLAPESPQATSLLKYLKQCASGSKTSALMTPENSLSTTTTTLVGRKSNCSSAAATVPVTKTNLTPATSANRAI